MKLTKFIKELQRVVDKHGDLEIYATSSSSGSPYSLGGPSVMNINDDGYSNHDIEDYVKPNPDGLYVDLTLD